MAPEQGPIDPVAALEQRIADLEAIHAVELGALRAERAAQDPEVQRQRAAVQKRDKERALALTIMRHAAQPVRSTLGHLQNGLQYGGLFPSSGNQIRDAMPGLVEAIEGVRALVVREPWPEGQRQLQETEGLKATASEALAEFDRRLAERKAARVGGR